MPFEVILPEHPLCGKDEWEEGGKPSDIVYGTIF